MAHAPSAFRAYILADAALVRGKLTRWQRAQVRLTETELRDRADDVAAQRKTGVVFRSRDKGIRLARRANTALSAAEKRLSFTLAAVLRHSKPNSSYSQALLEAGFSGKQIAEIAGSVALKTLASHFTCATPP